MQIWRPAAFLSDVLSTAKPVIWSGYNVWQLSGAEGSAADTAFKATYGWDPANSFFDTTDNKAVSHWINDVTVDTMTFDVIPGNAQVVGVSFLTAVRQGLFDGAEVTRYSAPMAAMASAALSSRAASRP